MRPSSGWHKRSGLNYQHPASMHPSLHPLLGGSCLRCLCCVFLPFSPLFIGQCLFATFYCSVVLWAIPQAPEASLASCLLPRASCLLPLASCLLPLASCLLPLLSVSFLRNPEHPCLDLCVSHYTTGTAAPTELHPCIEGTMCSSSTCCFGGRGLCHLAARQGQRPTGASAWCLPCLRGGCLACQCLCNAEIMTNADNDTGQPVVGAGLDLWC